MFSFFGESLAKRNAKKIAANWFPKILFKLVWQAMGSPRLSTLSDINPVSEEELLFDAVYNELAGVDNSDFGEGLFKKEFQRVYVSNKNEIDDLTTKAIKHNSEIIQVIMQTTAIKDVLDIPYFRTKTIERLSITHPENLHPHPNILKLCNDYCSFMEEIAFKYKYINGKFAL